MDRVVVMAQLLVLLMLSAAAPRHGEGRREEGEGESRPANEEDQKGSSKGKIAGASAVASSTSSSPDGSTDAAQAQTPSTEPQPGPPTKPAANRCLACRKKLGLLGFQCCCGETFCGAHRYAETHACGFDYKRAGRKRIADNNPVVVADKIARI